MKTDGPKRYGADIPIEIQLLNHENQTYTDHFSCNYETVDQYFREIAPYDNTVVTYLFIDTELDTLVACMSIACSAIFVQDSFSNFISAMEIKFFAVAEQYQHLPYQKNAKLPLAHYIMMHMLQTMWELSHSSIGASKVVLYSVPEAVGFYKRCSFKEFGDAMIGDQGEFVDGCLPMYFDLN